MAAAGGDAAERVAALAFPSRCCGAGAPRAGGVEPGAGALEPEQEPERTEDRHQLS